MIVYSDSSGLLCVLFPVYWMVLLCSLGAGSFASFRSVWRLPSTLKKSLVTLVFKIDLFERHHDKRNAGSLPKCHKHWARPKARESEAPIHVFLMGARGPSTCAIICCLPRHIGSKLDWKQSNVGLNQHSLRGCQCHKWPNPLCHSIIPSVSQLIPGTFPSCACILPLPSHLLLTNCYCL